MRTYYLFEEPEQTDAVDVSKGKMIPTVEPNEEPAEVLEPKPGFWRRQFQREVTQGTKESSTGSSASYYPSFAFILIRSFLGTGSRSAELSG